MTPKSFACVAAIVFALGLGCHRSRHSELPAALADAGNGEVRDSEDMVIEQMLSEFVADYVDIEGSPGRAVGLVIGVATPSNRYLAGFGATELGGQIAPSENALFDIASVTKVYTGYLLSKALARGVVTLDDVLDSSYEMAPSEQSIRLLDLVTHTSGLPNYPDNAEPMGPFNPMAGYSDSMLAAFLNSYAITTAPGSSYLYSNLGAGILGDMLVSNSGAKNYHALVQRDIAEPYGLHDTGVQLDAAQQERKLQGFRIGLPAPAIDIGAPLQGGGALRSSANEVLRFFEGALTPEDPAWAAVITPRRPSPNGQNAYTGFMLNIENPEGDTIYSKNGGAPGFTSQIMFSLDPPAVVVILANTAKTQGLYDLARDVLAEAQSMAEFQ